MKEIYLDNAAATPIDPRVIGAVYGVMREPGNPASFNDAGRRAAALLEDARKRVARFLNAHPSEIVFCASATEANALAFHGVPAGHRITQATEHTSVLKQIGKATVLEVDDQGKVDLDAVGRALTAKTTLISIMYANNEVGTIQPIKKIAKIKGRALLHVDACQATAYLPMDVQALGVDLLTLNGAKVHGPRGVAALFVRRGVEFDIGLRGTENVAGAVGLATALETIQATSVATLRDQLIEGILKNIPDARLNGPTGDARLANNVNISIPGVDSETLLLELDKYGIRAGAGSACTAHSVEPSHVLVAMGVPKKYLPGALRLTLSRHTTTVEIKRVIEVLPKAVAAVRKRKSPLR